jgi:transposase
VSETENLRAEIASLKQLVDSMREKCLTLEEQIEWFKRQIFGKRSEKILDPTVEASDLPGFVYPEDEEPVKTKPVSGHERRIKSKKGQDTITLPEGIPVETLVLDIPEEDKICKKTGEPLVKIGEEVSRKIAHKPGSYYIKEVIRPKYAVRNNPDAGVITEDLPDSLLSRCQADESFLEEMLVRKYCDHLPLYRQSEILSREKVLISRQVLCQWVIKAALALKPLHDLMIETILKSENVFVDETPIKMLDPGKGKTRQAYMWVLVGGQGSDPPLRIYDFYENRKHSNAEKLLEGYHGVLHSDKYGAYESMANTKKITWCPCWSHIRRKFFEAEMGDPKFRAFVLRKIKYLFMFEKIAWARSPEERLRIRQEKEVPIIDELIQEARSRAVDGKILPKSKLKEALGYFLGLAPHLKNFTKHPFARLDNNVAERAVRPLAIGRKNWLFVGSEAGGEAAAIVYSLIQTCRALNINPREYLEDVMRRIMGHHHNKLSELLPMQWAADRKKSVAISAP